MSSAAGPPAAEENADSHKSKLTWKFIGMSRLGIEGWCTKHGLPPRTGKILRENEIDTGNVRCIHLE
jgi:hypothetical protein